MSTQPTQDDPNYAPPEPDLAPDEADETPSTPAPMPKSGE